MAIGAETGCAGWVVGETAVLLELSLALASCSGATLFDFSGGESVSEPLEMEIMDRSAGNGAGFRGAVGRGGLFEVIGKTLRRIGEGEGARSDCSSSSL